LAKTYMAAPACADPRKDLVDRRPFGEAAQLPGQELLQRLTTLLGTRL
jgi:hypothetical protein